MSGPQPPPLAVAAAPARPAGQALEEQPPLPPDSPPPLPMGSPPPPTIIKLPGSVAGRAAAGSPAGAAAAARPKVAATPRKLVPDFVLSMWQHLSPRKAQPTSRPGGAQPSRLGRSGSQPAVAAAAEAGSDAAQHSCPVAAAAAPAATAAAPAGEEELEEGEIPQESSLGAVSQAGSATGAQSGVHSQPTQSQGSTAASSGSPAPTARGAQRSSPSSSSRHKERGSKKDKGSGGGSKVMAALRRTLRPAASKKEAPRRHARHDASPPLGSLVESVSKQAEQLQEQLASLSLAAASSGGVAADEEPGEVSSGGGAGGDVQLQLAALSSKLSQLTLCLRSIQGAAGGALPFALPAPAPADIMGQHFVAFDTNVLLDHLGVVRDWWRALQASGAPHIALLMPLAVIRELDGLKNSFRHYFAARRVISFIHQELLGSERYRGQREDELHRGLSRRGDDGILDCLLYMRARGAHVELCTEDRNLQVRVATEGIGFHTHKHVVAWLHWRLSRPAEVGGATGAASKVPTQAAQQQAQKPAAGRQQQQPVASATGHPEERLPAQQRAMAAVSQQARKQQEQPQSQRSQEAESMPQGRPLPPAVQLPPVPAATPGQPQLAAAQAQQPPQAPAQRAQQAQQQPQDSARSFFWDVVQARREKENQAGAGGKAPAGEKPLASVAAMPEQTVPPAAHPPAVLLKKNPPLVKANRR